MKTRLERLWYEQQPFLLLRPLSLLYRGITAIRRWVLQTFLQKKINTPLIIVGNISVGGVGKTPLVIAIADYFKKLGLRPAIVSRGYGARINSFPHLIAPEKDTAVNVGDEPLLIAEKTHCPVVIDPKRPRAVQYLEKNYRPDVIISDDGLQHYAMARSIEIIVVDGKRKLGNGYCLPAGPLREPPKRLKEADFLVVNGDDWPGAYQMQLKPGVITSIKDGQPLGMNLLQPVAAVAGIGHPQRFYDSLQQLGLNFEAYAFPDHYQYTEKDLVFAESTIIMTEKDAVKCRAFVDENSYALPVEAELPEAFWNALKMHPAIHHLENMEL